MSAHSPAARLRRGGADQRGRRRRRWRWLARLPLALYRARLGWLLGERFLVLAHRGRRTARWHQTMLEVVDHDGVADVYVVAAGWGERADWLHNVRAWPEVGINVGARHVPARAAQIDRATAARILRRYGQRHPLAFGLLTRFLTGRRLLPTPVDCEAFARRVPLVALNVRARAGAATPPRRLWPARACAAACLGERAGPAPA